jgi:acyl-coenzyme A thioesterase PaaI-like protein
MLEFQEPTVSRSYREDLALAIEAMPASRWLGLRVVGFAQGGISLIELPLRTELSFDGKIAQAGVVGMLADYAGVSAAASTLPSGWAASTTGYTVHNVAPALGSKLLAMGYAQHVGKNTAISSAQVWSQEPSGWRLVCTASTSCKPFQFA